MKYMIELVCCVAAILFWQYGFVEKNGIKKGVKQKVIGVSGAVLSLIVMILGFIVFD